MKENPQPEPEPQDYVDYVNIDKGVFVQWVEEAGEAHEWDKQVRKMKEKGYLSGENTGYDPEMS